MASSTPTSATCSICNDPAPKTCKGCGSSKYCLVECQQTDWPTHKLICRIQGKQAARPTPEHKLAILFNPESSLPRLEWIKCEVFHFPGHSYKKPTVDSYLGTDLSTRSIDVGFNVARKRALARKLRLLVRDTFLIDGSLTNEAILHAANEETPHDWRGPMIVVRGKMLPVLHAAHPLYDDITPADFRDLVDYLREYGETRSSSGPIYVPVPNAPKKVKAVRVSCDGDAAKAGKFTPTEVPFDHQIWTAGEVPQISRLVGLPIRTWKCPSGNVEWTGR